MRLNLLSVVATLLVIETLAQADYDYGDYQDYGGEYEQQDTGNMYYDYAQRQDQGMMAQGGGGGGSIIKLLVTGLVSWFMGARFHVRRAAKKIKRRHQSEQKQLYSQYYNDVYKLSEQNQVLQNQIQDLTELVRSTEAQAELEALQRDYDEFKQPDIDGDDRISRAEFNMYVKNYLSNYPGLSEKDYPKFDDFDHDGDGFVSFQEYSQQMALQAQQAELEQLYAGNSATAADKQKTKALNDLARGRAVF